MRRHVLGVAVVLCASVASTGWADALAARVHDVPAPAQPRPALSPMRVAAEVLAGAGVGIAAGGIGMFLGMQVDSAAGVQDVGAGYYFGTAVGAVVGVPAGVSLIGSVGDEGGSSLLSLAGTLVGAAVGYAAFLTATGSPVDDPDPPEVAVLALTSLALVGAVIGFNVTRRYDSPDAPQEAYAKAQQRPQTAALGNDRSARRAHIRLCSVAF